jgi:hypothetical protein
MTFEFSRQKLHSPEKRIHALLFGHFQSTISAAIRRFLTTYVYKCGQEFFDRFFLADGLAHIVKNIFDQFDAETLANCESVCESWQQFIIKSKVVSIF